MTSLLLVSFAKILGGPVGCVKCQLLWKWWLPQVFPMTLTPKNMEMPKNFKKIVSRGWSRAPLVLLHSVSIGRSEFYFYIHFDPVNQVRNPSKLNSLWGSHVLQEPAILAFSIPILILRLILRLVDSDTDTDTRKSENFDSDSDTDTKVKQVL